MTRPVTQADLDVFSNNHATLFVDGVAAVVGTMLVSESPASQLKAVAHDNYEFIDRFFPTSYKSVAIVTPSGSRSPFNISSDRKTATFNLTNFQVDYFEVETETDADYFIYQRDLDLVNSKNSVMAVNGEPIYLDMPIFHNDELVLTVEEGFKYLEVYGLGSNASRVDYLFNEEKTTATLIYKNGYEKPIHEIITEQIASEVKGTNNVYLVDNSILQGVNDERFIRMGTDNLVDFGKFILGLISVPSTLPPDYLLQENNIKLGDVSLTTKAVELKSDEIVYDLGEIKTIGNFGDFRDYKNSVCKLHLPNISPIIIDSDYVINESIFVEYSISCYSGKATVNIRSSKVGDLPIVTKTVNMGISIPYSAENDKSIFLNNGNIEVGGGNDVRTPFIEVLNSSTNEVEKFFKIPVNDEGILLNELGYVEIDNIDLNFKANKTDLEMVRNVLSNGIIIK